MRILGQKAHRLVACSAMAVFGLALITVQPPAKAQQPARTAPYTAEQANAGRATYQVKCASCHLPDLKGSNEAPPLTGINFTNMWGGRPASDLINRIRNTMPMTDPGSLGDEEAVDIVAYLLQANGAAAGTEPLTPASTAPVGAVSGGEGSTAAPPAPGRTPQDRLPQADRRDEPPARLRVLPFAGEVKNYVPVTDEMLRHPDPGDWLMVRGELPGLEPQPAHPDHARQREEPQAGLGVGDERAAERTNPRRSSTTASSIWPIPATSCRRSTAAPAI